MHKVRQFQLDSTSVRLGNVEQKAEHVKISFVNSLGFLRT